MDADPVACILRSSEALLFLANSLPEKEGGLALILFQIGRSLKQSGEELDEKEGARLLRNAAGWPERPDAFYAALPE